MGFKCNFIKALVSFLCDSLGTPLSIQLIFRTAFLMNVRALVAESKATVLCQTCPVWEMIQFSQLNKNPKLYSDWITHE